MTRTMGDATGANVAALDAAGLEMVAGYVTGTPDIQWTAWDWAAFSRKTVVTIDQGYQSPFYTTAVVRDVEAGAWTVGGAVNLGTWHAPRPTIYCSASVLPALAAAGWRGDVWVADYVNQAPTHPFPVPAGMTCVAWQWTDTGGGGAYDLSVVFDPDWPDLPKQEDDMLIITGGAEGAIYLLDGGKMSHVPDGADVAALQAAGVKTANLTTAYVTQLLADFPGGNPAVTVAPLTGGWQVTSTINPA